MNDAVIDLLGITKHYGGRTVLDNVSAQVHAGQVTGLVGLNGAGKTTMLETILGYALPDSGSATVLGIPSHDIGASPVAAKVGFVPQQEELLTAYRGRDYLALIAKFYRSWHDDTVDRLVTEWSIPIDRRISRMSLGERQKLAIASALGHRPELIVLDEPVASLDPLARRQFLREIVAIAADHDATVLFSTHIVTDLERVAERIWLLRDGQLIVDEDLDALKQRHPASLEDYFLEMHA